MTADVPIRLSDILRYLGAIGRGKVHCRSCNGTSFTLFAEPEGERMGLMSFQRPRFSDLSKVQTLEVVTLACSECGEVRMYERSRVAQWVAQHPLN
jgi:hypothetical protein